MRLPRVELGVRSGSTARKVLRSLCGVRLEDLATKKAWRNVLCVKQDITVLKIARIHMLTNVNLAITVLKVFINILARTASYI